MSVLTKITTFLYGCGVVLLAMVMVPLLTAKIAIAEVKNEIKTSNQSKTGNED